MKNTLLLMILTLWCNVALAEKFRLPIFRTEDGHTNWQHLANYTGSTLLILLSIMSVYLYLARRKLRQANHELTTIRNDLENRVKERTETLNQSNQLLLDSNSLLEEEISQHVGTSDQLRISESYIKDILTSMPVMLVGLDKNGYVTHWNKQVEDTSGVQLDEALGKTLWEAYPKTTVLPEHIQQAIEQNETIHLKRSLRSLYHYDITIYPLQEKEAGVVILIDDVTKQTAAKNMLIHNDKMSFMGELASTMAHDINMPLQAIMIDLKRFQRMISGQDITEPPQPSIDNQSENDLSGTNQSGTNQVATNPVTTDPNTKDPDTTDRAKLLNTIINDMSVKGEKVSTIISNLLAFARSRNGTKQKANIVDVMENTISLANEVLSASDDIPFNQIKIERNFEKNLPLVPCYITELQQVFLSLFRHACYALALKKEKEAFEPVIKILLSENYENIWIKIQHNGLGLTAEEQMNLFEPFFTDKSSAEGFDVFQHLSFSYYIVTEQHQGNMAVTSNVEVGSTIHIQLPIRD